MFLAMSPVSILLTGEKNVAGMVLHILQFYTSIQVEVNEKAHPTAKVCIA